jgi:hypothetical protein
VREHFYVVRGMADGFRFKDWHDYTSGVNNASATAFDTVCTSSAVYASSTYQLYKQYTKGNSSFTRKITKPLDGTVVVAVGSVAYPATDFTVSTTDGRITFETDVMATVSSISQESSAHVSATAHSYSVGDTVAFTSVTGMTEINGVRGTITSTTTNGFETDISTTSYTAYTDNGTAHTHPIDGEVIQAGYQFDVPVRFNSDFFDVVFDDYDIRNLTIEVVELRL